MNLDFLRKWPWYAWVGGGVALTAAVLAVVVSTSGMRSAEMGLTAYDGGYAVSQKAVRASANESAAYGSMMPEPAPSAGASAAEVDQKIIRTASLDLQVKDVPTAAKKVVATATGLGGFVQESSVSEAGDGSKYGSVTVRVPAEKFDGLLADLRALALVVRNESVSGQDVTEQYTDLAARLKNAKAQEQVYLDVLTRAKSVEDVLKVQSYLGSIRETIERYEGQLKYLENRTSLSTVTVSLSEEPAVPVPGKGFRPATAVQEAWRTLVTLAQGLVIFFIWFGIIGGAFLVPLVLAVWLVVWLIRRRFRQPRA